MEFRCPRCNKIIPYQNRSDENKNGPKNDMPDFFPFCSERCKLLDLGAWIDGQYRIPASEDDQDD